MLCSREPPHRQIELSTHTFNSCSPWEKVLILKVVEMERGEKKPTPTKTPAQEIGFLCLYYCEKLKEQLGVPVNGVGITCLGFCRVIHVDGSGLKMACTTLKGRKAAELTQGVYNSWKYWLFRVFVPAAPWRWEHSVQEDSLWRSVRTDFCFLFLGWFVVGFWVSLVWIKSFSTVVGIVSCYQN